MIIKLENEIKHGDKAIQELEVREPFVKLIRELGSPVKVNPKTGETDFNYDACCKYLEKLNALPPSVINQLTYKDFMKCVNQLLVFFNVGDSSQTAE